MKDWIDLIDRMGWPAAGLIFGIVVVWRGWVFVKPYVIRFMDAQLNLIDTVKAASERTADAVEKTSVGLTLLNKRHDRHDEQLQFIRESMAAKKL